MRIRTILEILQKTRHLIRYPEYWVKSRSATTVSGVQVHPHDEKAHCFCLVGAVSRALHDLSYPAWTLEQGVLKSMRHTLEPDGRIQLAQWNDDDERTHSQVMSMLDNTIGRLNNRIERGEE